MTWCITTCNFDIDVDLLFQENSTIGQKMWVTSNNGVTNQELFLPIGWTDFCAMFCSVSAISIEVLWRRRLCRFCPKWNVLTGWSLIRSKGWISSISSLLYRYLHTWSLLRAKFLSFMKNFTLLTKNASFLWDPQWLVKKAIETREEMGDYVRSYSISQFQKTHTFPEVRQQDN